MDHLSKMFSCFLASDTGAPEIDEHPRPWGNPKAFDDLGQSSGRHGWERSQHQTSTLDRS
jgi:hypothetical protein